MKSLQDIFEFKTPYHFFGIYNCNMEKKFVGFYTNNLHCKFEFFTKHLTSQDILFFYLCSVSASIKGLPTSVTIMNFIVFDTQSTAANLASSPSNKIYERTNVLQSNMLSYFTSVIGGELSLSDQ